MQYLWVQNKSLKFFLAYSLHPLSFFKHTDICHLSDLVILLVLSNAWICPHTYLHIYMYFLRTQTGSQHRHGILCRAVSENVHLIITPSPFLKANGLFGASGQVLTPMRDYKTLRGLDPSSLASLVNPTFPLHNEHLPAWTPSARNISTTFPCFCCG